MSENQGLTADIIYSRKNSREWTTKSGIRIIKIIGGRSNVFLISDNDRNVLIDTSPGFKSKILLKRLEKLKVRTIDYLILTHSHFDHAANAFMLKERFGARVVIHQSEADYLFSGDSPMPAGTNAFSAWLVRNFSQKLVKIVRYPSCPADILVNDTLNLSLIGINIIHTPGHTTGSLSIIVDQEIALVGDSLFGIFPGSCFPPFANDVTSLIKSWEILLNTGCSLYLPSHGWGRTRLELAENLKSKQA
ncbi:MAG: MBL fold metallo-hydrolase [Lentimicrobium sp.]|nr:MBL fold metallo-hydrolase [Lentimicrobium sp.]